MSPSEVIGEAWGLYKRHWRHLLPIALVVYLLLSLLALLFTLLLGWLGVIAAIFVSIAGVFWLQAALVVAVDDIRDGRPDLSVRETLSRVRERINTISIAGILAALGITIGLLLLVVPGLVLMTWWALIVPAIMLERKGAGEAFGRSRELVRGNGWNVFGLILLLLLVLIAVGIAIGLVLALLLSVLDDSLQQYVIDVVSNTITAPFVALAFTLAYFRLREREVAPAAAETPAL